MCRRLRPAANQFLKMKFEQRAPHLAPSPTGGQTSPETGKGGYNAGHRPPVSFAQTQEHVDEPDKSRAPMYISHRVTPSRALRI